MKVWDFNTAVKRVEFNEDGTQLLAVTEKRMGFLGTIVILDVKVDVEAEQSDEKALTITCDEAKATVAGWSYLSKYIIAGHEDGTVSQYDAKVGDILIPPPSPSASMRKVRSFVDKTCDMNRPANSSKTSTPTKTACKSLTSKCLAIEHTS